MWPIRGTGGACVMTCPRSCAWPWRGSWRGARAWWRSGSTPPTWRPWVWRPGGPCRRKSTIRRVLQDLDPVGLDALLTSWLHTRTGAIEGRTVIAVDGWDQARGPHWGQPGASPAGGPGPGPRSRRGTAAGGRQVQRDPSPTRAARPLGPGRSLSMFLC